MLEVIFVKIILKKFMYVTLPHKPYYSYILTKLLLCYQVKSRTS